MTSARLHTYSALPVPDPHAGVSSAQSKSHVLAGVQDAYWSDDEAEDAECPLCLEEMDISDLNFKPCPCGYQICRFCWHHIKENLNGRCPACRREYTDETVQFKPINNEDHKRLTQQKKQRERERKELDALGRRHLANVRVVQRNVVYVVGIGPRFAKEELVSTLRSNEYFGQYGKITKIVLVKRTPPGGRAPVVGLYITYHRKEDAARAIAAVDGAPSPGGGNEVMRASYGTAKYCMNFLRGNSCNEHGCVNLHEWGDEKDCFTKEDLSTLKHAMKDMENRPRNTGKKEDSEGGLPRAASWAHKNPSSSTALHNSTLLTNQSTTTWSTSRQSRRGAGSRQSRTTGGANESRTSSGRNRGSGSNANAIKASSQASSSRPATPAVSAAAVGTKSSKQEKPAPPAAPRSPTSSVAVESDAGSGSQDVAPALSAVRPESAAPTESSVPSVPPGIPAVPPGLSAPPGLPPPKRVPSSSDQLSQLPSQSSYQVSTQVQALLDDVMARREAAAPVVVPSPFPDLDRMLDMLSGGDGEGFSFNLDPTLAGESSDPGEVVLEPEANVPFQGSYYDAFPGLRTGSQPSGVPYGEPPGLSYPSVSTRPLYDPLGMRSPSMGQHSASYSGSFDPFGDSSNDASSRAHYSPLDDERKVSRFGFARGRQGSTAASSPMISSSPVVNGDHFGGGGSFYNSPRLASPAISQAQSQWGYQRQHPDFTHHQPGSAAGSPLVQQAQAVTYQSPPMQQAQATRFQPFDEGVSEAQLRDFIQSSRERANISRSASYDQQQQQQQPQPQQQQSSYKYTPGQPFDDPAIMSARFAPPAMPAAVADASYAPSATSNPSYVHGPPPGLSAGSAAPSPALSNAQAQGGQAMEMSQAGSAQVSSPASPVPSPPVLSNTDFPALNADPRGQQQPPSATIPASPSVPETEASVQDLKAREKEERRAAKKAEREERAAQRVKAAQEKAAAKAVEKAEKAREKERSAAVKAEQEREEKEKREQERQERAEKAEREREEKAAKLAEEKEKAEFERAEKEKAKKAAEAAKASKQAAAAASKKDRDASPTTKGSSGKSSSRQNSREVLLTSPPPEPAVQVPILSKMPKKNKPSARPIKIPREDDISGGDAASGIPSASASDAPQLPTGRSGNADGSSNNSRAQSVDRTPPNEPTSLTELLLEIDSQCPWMRIADHPFFDLHRINPAAKMPLEYGPLVHALSALSVGGGSFANNMPSGSIDNAVSSFQQLLETLTQTISDLLRLLPRTTWDDSSSFDGVLRDMLKGDDFLDDGTEENGGNPKEDEVAALTLALERRARWMEVQLSKLEELHRDINTAAVRAVLAFNDNGWDRHGFLPRVGNTLQRFDRLGLVEGEGGKSRPMTADELEKKLSVAKEAAVFAETEVREAVERMNAIKPEEEDDF